MSDAAFRIRRRACALLLAALGAVLTVLPSRGVSSESAAPEAKAEVYQAWPFDAAEAKRRQEETAKRLGIPVERTLDLGNGVKLELVLIPAGRFVMGTPEPEPVDEEGFRRKILTGQVILGIGGGAFLVLLGIVLVRAIRKRQRPQYSLAWFLAMTVVAGIGLLGGMHWHFSARALADAQREYEAALAGFKSSDYEEKLAYEVTIGAPYYLGKCEVTQEQFQQVVGTNPSHFKGCDLPVDKVSWNDAQSFCTRASSRIGFAVRLPTETEWEHACRAGTKTTCCSGDTETDLDQTAWYHSNSGHTTHPVGQKAPNAWAIYDMHGNVWEYVQDDYRNKPEVDSQRAAWGQDRISRGGSWNCTHEKCRSTSSRRSGLSDNHIFTYGFRVVVVVPRTP